MIQVEKFKEKVLDMFANQGVNFVTILIVAVVFYFQVEKWSKKAIDCNDEKVEMLMNIINDNTQVMKDVKGAVDNNTKALDILINK